MKLLIAAALALGDVIVFEAVKMSLHATAHGHAAHGLTGTYTGIAVAVIINIAVFGLLWRTRSAKPAQRSAPRPYSTFGPRN